MNEIFKYFLHLGFLGFGGPLALVAQMQRELVVEKKWMTEDDFRSAFGMIKTMPGPVAFQTAVFLGRVRGGFFGGTLAGLCLILPSFVLMILLAMFYQSMNVVPWIQHLMHGMQIAAFALIAWALKSLAQNLFREKLFWFLFVVCLASAAYSFFPEPVLIIGSGLVAVGMHNFFSTNKLDRKPNKLAAVSPLIIPLALVCLKAGAFVFGTGLAIVPLLETDFVNRLHWLTHTEFMDALAFGQLTPGPVVITVTFIGYKVAGLLGAGVATAGVFLPSFIHMTTWFPLLLNWMIKQTWIKYFSLGVTAAVCSTIVLSLIRIGNAWSYLDIVLAVLFVGAMYFTKLPSWFFIIIGGSMGLILY